MKRERERAVLAAAVAVATAVVVAALGCTSVREDEKLEAGPVVVRGG